MGRVSTDRSGRQRRDRGNIGASGEIMGLFWPRLDHGAECARGHAAVYLGHPQQGRFLDVGSRPAEAVLRRRDQILGRQLFFDDGWVRAY